MLLIALLWLADRLWPLPLPRDDLARVVLAEDGTPLWRFADANGVWRYPVSNEQVSPYYLEALLTYEDRWFYRHPGVNPLALLRATWQNLSDARVVSGGSTLSMQVARLLDPHSRTLSGKFRQLWRTLQLEWHLSKDQILSLYLNRAPFGGTQAEGDVPDTSLSRCGTHTCRRPGVPARAHGGRRAGMVCACL